MNNAMNSMVNYGHKVLSNRYFYTCYQYCVGGTQYRDRVIKQALNIMKPCSVLDLGCGPGPTFRVLPPEIKFHGIDLSADYLKLAQKKRPSANLILGDVTAGDWHKEVHGEEFNLVLAMGLFHHLSDHQMERLISNLSLLLLPGSTIFSVDPTIKSDTSKMATWFANNDRGKYVRSPEKLLSFFDYKNFSTEIKVQESQFNIPLDSVELIIQRN